MIAFFYDKRLDSHRVKFSVYGRNRGEFRIAFRFRGWTHVMVINTVTGGMCLECPATKYFNCTKDDAIIGMASEDLFYHALNIMVTAAHHDIVVVVRPGDSRRESQKGD